MNLKEAFRFQNKIQSLTDEISEILSYTSNITQVKNTYLRKKVMPEAENETIFDEPQSEYAENITALTDFMMYLLAEREKLSAAVRKTKEKLPIDMDSEVGLNAKRQDVRRALMEMDAQRNGEQTLVNGGTGYRFNAEGNQVSYLCDVKRVTTINFDRNVVKRHIAELNRKIDDVSNEIDRCMVNFDVDYAAPFDVNDTLTTVFEAYINR